MTINGNRTFAMCVTMIFCVTNILVTNTSHFLSGRELSGLYKISFTYMALVGFIITFIGAAITSLILGTVLDHH